MIIELKANLPDTPGTLIKMLAPISDNAGNIASVIHSHDEKRGEKVPVIVRFDLPEDSMEKKLANIKEELEKLSIEITEITHVLQREQINAILTGHVFQTDFIDTYKRINAVGAKITRIEALFTEIEDYSNVKFEIQCDADRIFETVKTLKDICKEKSLSLICDK